MGPLFLLSFTVILTLSNDQYHQSIFINTRPPNPLAFELSDILDFCLLTPTSYVVAEFTITHDPEPTQGHMPKLDVYELVENDSTEVEPKMGRRTKYKPRKIMVFELPRFREMVQIRKSVIGQNRA